MPNNKAPMNPQLMNLPADAFGMILSFLPAYTLAGSANLVCKAWQHQIKQHLCRKPINKQAVLNSCQAPEDVLGDSDELLNVLTDRKLFANLTIKEAMSLVRNHQQLNERLRDAHPKLVFSFYPQELYSISCETVGMWGGRTYQDCSSVDIKISEFEALCINIIAEELSGDSRDPMGHINVATIETLDDIYDLNSDVRQAIMDFLDDIPKIAKSLKSKPASGLKQLLFGC